jgi:hypothetical protein
MKKTASSEADGSPGIELRTRQCINKARKASKRQQAKKPNRENKIILRVTEDEKKAIEQQAGKHANGNVSEWIRIASIIFEP